MRAIRVPADVPERIAAKQAEGSERVDGPPVPDLDARVPTPRSGTRDGWRLKRTRMSPCATLVFGHTRARELISAAAARAVIPAREAR